jgi:hypothetical protein
MMWHSFTKVRDECAKGLLRLLLGILAAFLPACAAAQFEVSFSLSKTTHLAGEPVFLSLRVKNVSTEPLQISTADPLTFCSGDHFELQGARDRDAMSCMSGFGGSCLSAFQTLAPRKSRTDRILLNLLYDLRRPGSYPLKVVYRAEHAPAGKNLPVRAKWSHQDFEKRLDIVLAPSKPEDLKPEFEAYARALASPDWRKRQEPASDCYRIPRSRFHGTHNSKNAAHTRDAERWCGRTAQFRLAIGSPRVSGVRERLVPDKHPNTVSEGAAGTWAKLEIVVMFRSCSRPRTLMLSNSYSRELAIESA